LGRGGERGRGYIVVAVSGLEDAVDAVGGAAAENDVGEGALLLVFSRGRGGY
jgi:hypothetical protein